MPEGYKAQLPGKNKTHPGTMGYDKGHRGGFENEPDTMGFGRDPMPGTVTAGTSLFLQVFGGSLFHSK